MSLLQKTLDRIKPLDEDLRKAAMKYWDNIAHPIGSLGELELISSRIIAMTGDFNYSFDKKVLAVFCSDNGVYEEGCISVLPQEVTSQLAKNMLNGQTIASILCDFADSDIEVIDVGLLNDCEHTGIINKKLASGSKNMCKGPAMSREDAIKIIEYGIEIGDDLFSRGYKIIGTGELGIGNTTTSSAVLSALTGLSPEVTCGKGSGLTNEMYMKKIACVKKALDLHKTVADDPIEVLSKLGGFDMAGICGLFLSAAKNRVPVVIDGYISAVGALLAKRLKKESVDYMLPSHLSDEPGAIHIFKELGIEAIFNFHMRLGEGAGCLFTFKTVEAAFRVMREMATFDQLNIDNVMIDIREGKQ